jgi:hypothetical protein
MQAGDISLIDNPYGNCRMKYQTTRRQRPTRPEQAGMSDALLLMTTLLLLLLLSSDDDE